MIITRESIGELNDVLTIKISESDYKEKVDNSLKAQSKKVKLPGFRPGTVPISHVQKLYGREILFEQLNKILSESLQNYLKDQNINLIGNPIPLSEGGISPGSEKNTDFEFRYEIGLTPKIEIKDLPKGPLKQYNIELDSELLNSKISNLRRAYGKISQPELSVPGDVLSLHLEIVNSEISEFKEFFPRKITLRTELVTHPASLKNLTGLKIGDKGILNLQEALGESSANLGKLLDLSEEQAKKIHFDFQFDLLSISRIEPAELNSTFFEKCFPETNIKTELEFNEAVGEEIKKSLRDLAEKKLDTDLILECLKSYTSVLPHQFLRKWLLYQKNSQYTEENLPNLYPDFEKSLKWSIISDNLAKEFSIEVKPEEMVSSAKERIKNQLKLYSPEPISEEELNEYSMRFLQNQEQVSHLYEEVLKRKILDFLREKIPMEINNITYNDFIKLS